MIAALGAHLAHHFAGGVYAKETRIPAGMVLVQHLHLHDHLSLLASGSVELEVDGARSTHVAPACLKIEAGKYHGVKALTDSVWYCIHAVPEDDLLTLDEIARIEAIDAALIAPDSSDARMREIAEALS